MIKVKEAEKQLNRSQKISNYIDIPSQSPPITGETESHPHFSKYDHSLEANRLPELRKKYNYQDPEPVAQTPSKMKMSTKPYENIDPSEVPNLNGIFDGVF